MFSNISLRNLFLFILSISCITKSFCFENVNLNTGQLSFSEQLVNAIGSGVNLPINLNYNSRIFSDQKTNWVGKGFDLDVPYIERIVVGAPDETNSNTVIENGAIVKLNQLPLFYKELENGGIWKNNIEKGVKQDNYTLHHANGNFQLFFSTPYGGTNPQNKDSLKIACNPYKPWQIHYHYAPLSNGTGDIEGWTIIDENGIKYIFDKKVTAEWDYYGSTIHSLNRQKDVSTFTYVSSFKDFNSKATCAFRWYLSSIVPPTNQQNGIFIKYSEKGSSTEAPKQYIQKAEIIQNKSTESILELKYLALNIQDVPMPNTSDETNAFNDERFEDDFIVLQIIPGVINNTDNIDLTKLKSEFEMVRLAPGDISYRLLNEDEKFIIKRPYPFTVVQVLMQVRTRTKENYYSKSFQLDKGLFSGIYKLKEPIIVKANKKVSSVLSCRLNKINGFEISEKTQYSSTVSCNNNYYCGYTLINLRYNLNQSNIPCPGVLEFVQSGMCPIIFTGEVFSVGDWYDSYVVYEGDAKIQWPDNSTKISSGHLYMYEERPVGLIETSTGTQTFSWPISFRSVPNGSEITIDNSNDKQIAKSYKLLSITIDEYACNVSVLGSSEEDLDETAGSTEDLHVYVAQNHLILNNNLVPVEITTPTQKIEFLTTGEISSSKYNRGLLKEIRIKNKDNTLLNTILFTYQSTNNKNYLKGLYTIKNGKHSRIYDFNYNLQLGEAPLIDGSIGGMIDGILTSTGKFTKYIYEKGRVSYLSNRDAVSISNWGYVVKEIQTFSDEKSAPLTYILNYKLGEVPYFSASCLNSEIINKINTTNDFEFTLRDFNLTFGETEVNSPNGIESYKFATSANFPVLADNSDEYHINKMLRDNLIYYSLKAKNTTLINETINNYKYVDLSDKGFLYSKSNSEFSIYTNLTTNSIDNNPNSITISQNNFDNSSFNGAPAAITAKSGMLLLASTIKFQDGIKNHTEYSYDDQGFVTETIEHNSSTTPASALVSVTKRAVDEYKNSTNTENKNIYQNLTTKNLVSLYTKNIIYKQETIDGINSRFPLSCTIEKLVYPLQPYTVLSTNQIPYTSNSYAWNVPKSDGEKPEDVLVEPKPDDFSSYLTNNNEWRSTSSIVRRSVSGIPLESKTIKGISSTTFYRFDKMLKIGDVTNAALTECAVFTGDYNPNSDMAEYNNMFLWRFPEFSCQNVNPPSKHYAEKVLSCPALMGPSKKLHLISGKHYVFSAWVFVPTGSGKFKLTGNLYENDVITRTYTIFTNKSVPVGSWQKISTTFKIDNSSLNGTLKNYLDIQISSLEDRYYIEDIRINPEDAFVTSFFYNEKNLLTCTVDDNDNASYITYDDLGRIIQTEDDSHFILSKNQYFTNAEQLLFVNYPEIKDKYSVNEKLIIKWFGCHELTGDINIYFSNNNGENWILLNKDGALDHTYSNWGTFEYPLSNQMVGSHCKFKIESTPTKIANCTSRTFSIE